MGQNAETAIEHLLRELAPQVLGVVTRRYRDFALAEDAVQETMLAAFHQWPAEGIPENPRAWLIRVASRRITDMIRSEIARRQRETALTPMEEPAIGPPEEIEAAMDPEDTLVLLFMCCHRALSKSSAIALTLRAVGGLTTAEIANAFMVPEATMAQRITRAKQSIKASGVPFGMPTPQARKESLSAVLHVLYLIFSEGYASSIGAHIQRLDLAHEAIRLTRSTRALLPEDAEVAGLLALMLLTNARRRARTEPDGELIPLDKQDRNLWDRAEIAEGTALLTLALSKGAVGLYQLQAAIAAVHDEAARAQDTDWPQILALYELLLRVVARPHGFSQPCCRVRHGAWPGSRSGAAASAGQRRTTKRALSTGSRARPFVRNAGRLRERGRALPKRRQQDDQPAGTTLSDDPGGPA